MIIACCLLILAVLSIFSVVLGSSFMGIVSQQSIDNTAIVNGTSTTFVIEGTEFYFNIDPITGAIAMIITFSAMAVFFGIKLFGSGLSDETVRVLTIAVIYTALWTVLSLLPIPLLFSIEVFGALIYVVLTIAYVGGVVQKFSGVS